LFCSFDKAGQSDESDSEWTDEADKRSDAGDRDMKVDSSREMSDASENDDDDDDDDDDDASQDLSSGETEGLADDKNTSSTFHTGNYRLCFLNVHCGLWV